MASLEKRRWEGDPAGLTRRDRRPCAYEVYLPDRLTGRRFVLHGDVAADVGDAEAALLKLDASAAALAGTEALARLLLRAESVASSRIEGLEVGGRRLLRADAARQLGEASRDVTALEVLGNIDAMVWGVDTVEPGGPITLRHPARSASPPAWRGRAWRTTGDGSAPCRTGSAAAPTTPAPPSSCRPRPRRWRVCWTTCSPSATTTRSRPSPRPPSPTRSSRRFTPSWTGTGAPDGC